MPAWLIYSLVTVGLWGVWGVFGKLAARSVTAETLMLLGSIGGLLVFPVYVAIFHRHLRFSWDRPDYYFAVLAGVLGTIGALFYYQALAHGEASRVVAVTAIYPVVTVLLVYLFLREPLNAQKIIGIALAVAGVLLLSR